LIYSRAPPFPWPLDVALLNFSRRHTLFSNLPCVVASSHVFSGLISSVRATSSANFRFFLLPPGTSMPIMYCFGTAGTPWTNRKMEVSLPFCPPPLLFIDSFLGVTLPVDACGGTRLWTRDRRSYFGCESCVPFHTTFKTDLASSGSALFLLF